MFMNAFFFLLLPERHSSRGYRLTLKRKIHFLNVINPRSWWEVISGPLPWWKWRGINRATYFQIPLSVGKEVFCSRLFPWSPHSNAEVCGSWMCDDQREYQRDPHLCLSEARDFLPKKGNDSLCFLLQKIHNLDIFSNSNGRFFFF